MKNKVTNDIFDTQNNNGYRYILRILNIAKNKHFPVYISYEFEKTFDNPPTLQSELARSKELEEEYISLTI